MGRSNASRRLCSPITHGTNIHLPSSCGSSCGARRSGARFPGEDGGRSLAEMAQRDLDAALQLLADRAQFITGASGAAIALRRRGMNDMLCRASAGSNAPELGALLSAEFGLSGESVRTRQLLRCDDAERDARVNHDVCRQLGIASVVVMPVVNDDEVLGVFELFSGKANAFGERDLSAVQRLSEMVETAVRMAEATEKLPENKRLDFGRLFMAFRDRFPFLVGGSEEDAFERRQVDLAQKRLAPFGLEIARLAGGHMTTDEEPGALADLIARFEREKAARPAI